MSARKVLLVGTVSNVSSILEIELNRVLNALQYFSEIDIYLVESDSTDSTLQILRSLSRKMSNFSFVTLGKLSPYIPNRIERLRYCRNTYVEHIRGQYSKENLEYVIVADLDGMNSKLNEVAVASCFQVEVNWDACFANQLGGYSDIYALRCKDWQDGDCFVELHDKTKAFLGGHNSDSIFKSLMVFLHKNKIRNSVIYSKMRKIPKSFPPVKVDSAFGGFAIYKSSIFFDYDYNPREKGGALVSEHVDLHLKISDSNLYINPALVNAYWNTYNVNRFGLIRFARVLIRKSSSIRGIIKLFASKIYR
jgi:glycosyltransferase involved in cell wall biosynthesis